MKLNEIETLLINEGFKVSPQTVNINGIDVPTLNILIELEDKTEEQGLDLNLLFVPGIDDQLEGCHILQMFIVLAESIDTFAKEKIQQLNNTLAEFNFNLPIGSYGVRDKNQMLYYKHMMMLPIEMNEGSRSSFIQSIWMVAFVQNQCYPIIEGILDKETA